MMASAVLAVNPGNHCKPLSEPRLISRAERRRCVMVCDEKNRAITRLAGRGQRCCERWSAADYRWRSFAGGVICRMQRWPHGEAVRAVSRCGLWKWRRRRGGTVDARPAGGSLCAELMLPGGNRLTEPRLISRAERWCSVIICDAKDRATTGPAGGGVARVGVQRIIDGGVLPAA